MLYRFQEYELDDRLYELRRTGVPVDLEHKVFDVLFYLLQHRDRVVPKDELLDKMWPGMVVGEAALTRCVTAARKALGDDGGKQEVIKTQHGRGYRFVASVTLAPLVVSSQEEETNQKSKVKNQKSKMENSPESSVQSQEEVASSQYSIVSREEERQEAKDKKAKGLSLEAEGLLPPSPSGLQPDASSLPQSLLSSPPRFWSRKVLLLTAASLLIGTVLTVQYLSRPLLSPQPLLPNPFLCPTSLPLQYYHS